MKKISAILSIMVFLLAGCNEVNHEQPELSAQPNVPTGHLQFQIEGQSLITIILMVYDNGFFYVENNRGWSSSYFNFDGSVIPDQGYYMETLFNGVIYKVYLVEITPEEVTLYTETEVLNFSYGQIEQLFISEKADG